MPMTSQQIAQLNGGYSSMHMGQMAHAGMIGAQGPMYGNMQSTGEGMFSGAASRVGAVAGPATALGLGVMGLDPISMGASAAWGARGAGLLGAGAAGLAAAAPMAGVMMAGQYAGGQMMQGMQQQQQFNTMMRSNYGHLGGPGGEGLGTGQLGGMGQSMRQMASQVGPMGEMTNFEELGRLASNMGRMGMTQGVRDAREFSEKFKQMVSTLKEVAKHMGTSLEEAQKMMNNMKSSGIFGQGNQQAVLQGVSQVARSTGMSTSEVTGMMGIGSQIARMTGGRGRHGAMAGMQAASILGTAGQMGILSEEDIYDVTGQTGAQGRQAFASQMLQTSARFLKGNLGRRAVAAMMGPEGGLNEEAVEEFMAGGVGTGRTMQLAHKNLAKVGRAGFIRNEGRTRGQIMARFGGLAPAAIMRGWMQQRGMDVDDDRSAIFMQRRLGMGRDETDQMMKMVRELPRIMQMRDIRGQQASEEAQIDSRIREVRGRTGVEGLKRKFGEARAKVQQTLQQVGADIMESGSDMLDRFVNRLTGQYVERYEKDAMSLYRSAVGGGPLGDQVASMYFGVGGRGAGFVSRFAGARQQMFGGGIKGGPVGAVDRERLQEAGFGFAAAGKTGQEVQDRLGQLRGMHRAMLTGGKGIEKAADFRKFGAEAQDDLKMALATGRIFGAGHTRVETFGHELQKLARRNPKYKELSRRFASADSTEKAAMMANSLGGAGALVGEAEMMDAPGLLGDLSGRFATARQRHMAKGISFLHGPEEAQKLREQDESFWGRVASGAAAGAIGGAIGGSAVAGVGAVVGAGVGALLGGAAGALGVHGVVEEERLGGARAAAIGEFLESQEARDIGLGALTGTDEQQARSRRLLQSEAAALQRKRTRQGGELDRQEQAKLDVFQGMLFAQDVQKFMGPDGRVDQRRLQQYARDKGRDPTEIMNMVRAVGGSLSDDIGERRRQVARQISEQAHTKITAMTRSGTLVPGGQGQLRLTEEFSEQLGGIGTKTSRTGKTDAQIFVQSMIDKQVAESAATEGNIGQTIQDVGGIVGRGEEALTRMSVAEKRELAGTMAGRAGMQSARRRLLRGASLEEAMQKAGRGQGENTQFGATAVMARSLGADVSGQALKKIYEKASEDAPLEGDRAVAQAIIDKMGVSEQFLAKNPGAMDNIKQIVQASRTGGKTVDPETGQTISAVQLQEKFQERFGGAISREKLRRADPLKADMAEHLGAIKGALEGMPDKIASAMKGVKITVVEQDAEAKEE